MIFASPNVDIPTGGTVIKENINEEAQHVRELLEQEMKEKEQLQQLIESLEIEIKSKEKLILQKDQQINLKNATIEDLKVGLTIFETKVKQLEQRVADLSKPQPTTSPQPVQQIAPQPVQQTKPAPQPAPQPAQQTKPAPQLHERNDNVLKLSGGYEDTERKTAVREAFSHAWGSYRKYAWGMDELKPVSKSSYNWLGLGVTIIDSLDTLWIMDMKDEFTDARNWIDEHLSFDINRDVSVFETTIRELGGLLSAYEFSRDRMFLNKAEDLARRLLASFNTKTNLPNGSVNLKTMTSRPLSWTGGASILSEIGTLQLEFLYLAYHTNNPQYAIKPLDVFKHLDSLEKDRGLYNLYVDVNSGNMRGSEISLGALGDSFYEYMVKLWLFTNKQFNGYSRMYQESSVGIKEVLVQTTPSGYRYVAQVGRSGRVEYKMEHLTCFSGGMFALGAMHNINPEFVSDDIQLGADITESCHESYTRTKTHIGPEYFEFHGSQEFVVPDRGRHYLLRPETVESYFILWRTTHDPKYRDWAWEAFQAIEQYCRLEGGYSGLQNVDSEHPGYDDLQQSFFLAETLKYLYLIFTDDDVVPLDKYVFNTEAHPLGIITDPIDSWPQEL